MDVGLKNVNLLKNLISTYFNSPISRVKVKVVDLLCDHEFYEYPLEPNELVAIFEEVVRKGENIFFIKKETGRLIKVEMEGFVVIVQMEITPL